jgi:hypothetical protein
MGWTMLQLSTGENRENLRFIIVKLILDIYVCIFSVGKYGNLDREV